MLKVNQLARRYGAIKAVDDVTFAIDRGEIVGLLGHNGAGKTTVMKIISGYLEPDRGEVTVDGVDLTADPKAVQRQLGYLPESLPLYPEMSVADYLDYAATLKGLEDGDKAKEIARVVEATAIADKFSASINTLSRGYKQRVGVAQAILGRPKLLILDEPTNGLDPEQTQYMRALIRELSQQATVILSTHIMQEVDALCSRALILRSGQLVVDSRLAALRHSRNLLLTSSLAIADMAKLQALPGIDRVIADDNHQPDRGDNGKRHNHHRELTENHYRIALPEEVDQRLISAAIVKFIVEAGADVYTLQPEYRNLEALFYKANEENYQRGAMHVADS